MIHAQFIAALRKIYERIKDSDILWAVTGSLGMALQGMDLPVHDIDIQTDQQGAYEIEGLLSEHTVSSVRYLQSERIRSHLGKFEINGIQVEIMGAIQKCGDDEAWEEPVPVEQYRKWVEIEGMQIPVLSLEYEYQAYLKMGRVEKANAIRQWLQMQK